MATRTFLAVDISEAVRQRLAEAMRQLLVPEAKIRWVRPENLHVTVRFLGDVEDGQMAGLCEAVAQAAAGLRPFEFAVERLLVIPPGGRVRMVWAGVDDASGQMIALHDRLQEALHVFDVKRDNRPFRPHLTLGRVKSIRRPEHLCRLVEPYAAERFGTVQAEEVIVYSSKLTPAGPVYAPLARARFES